MLTPAVNTVPDVRCNPGDNTPAAMRNNVDFPLPDPPTMPSLSPISTFRSTD
ncbi:unannotated protein [freshwater metagenome]|uniref:Unannotated protein n=1 Tax=freshwater metagenome TaxID=449393 RepID=A0A6J6XPQ1_9ZZZZ